MTITTTKEGKDLAETTALRRATSEKIKIGDSVRRALTGLFLPTKIIRAIRAHRAPRTYSRAKSDGNLKLYSEFLPSNFLHFGFFEDPHINLREISIADIELAQLAYEELFIERMRDSARPVLDVGCGMGGFCARLFARGFVPVALTPDAHQIAYIENKYPRIERICGMFEEIDAKANLHRFGTIINAESLQYLNLEKATELVTEILAPAGRWLICDFFKTSGAYKGSGHDWARFIDTLAVNNLSVVFERDITPNVVVTLRYAHMVAQSLGVPIMRLAVARLARKHPGVHSMLREFIDDLFAYANNQIETIDPEKFVREKRYVFLEVARSDEVAASLH
jgi:SAM-dependent methyltransferase